MQSQNNNVVQVSIVPHVAGLMQLYSSTSSTTASCGEHACMHVDSSHNSVAISQDIRSDLSLEGQRKLDEQDCPSTPMRWLKDHPGKLHEFNTETMPSSTPHVPRQRNGYDCGLYVLAFMDFWSSTPPDNIEVDTEGAWTGKHLPAPATQV